jgi:sec-independent protein translocase protein TatC
MRTNTERIDRRPLAFALAAAAEAMTFLEHLDELRKRIAWAGVSVAVAFGICWTFATDLYELASAPIRSNPAVTLAVARPQDIISLHLKVTLVAALFLAAPRILWQVWLFVAPLLCCGGAPALSAALATCRADRC